MPDGSDAIEIHALAGIDKIAAEHWDSCAGSDNPFVSHAFLLALEQSGSATAETGWLPQHLVAHSPDGQVVGVVPLYIKSHSFGEYVFDWAWANWLHQHGKPYYPKLQVSVPFSPVTGPRLLTADDKVADALCQALLTIARQSRLSSLHITFPLEAEAHRLERYGFLLRQGLQFQWTNDGYQTFDDFLGALASRKRKQIRKERLAVVNSGVIIDTLVGADIKPVHWDWFYEFYQNTTDSKMGETYLTRAFFELLSASSIGDKVVLMIAHDQDGPCAGAFNLMGSDTLYGRNWGAVRDIPFVHFEACYYRALEFAIERGLKRVEAGAQGPHKLDRGYLPVATWSAHWIADPVFAQAIGKFLTAERASVTHEIAKLGEMGPFKKGETTEEQSPPSLLNSPLY